MISGKRFIFDPLIETSIFLLLPIGANFSHFADSSSDSQISPVLFSPFDFPSQPLTLNEAIFLLYPGLDRNVIRLPTWTKLHPKATSFNKYTYFTLVMKHEANDCAF